MLLESKILLSLYNIFQIEVRLLNNYESKFYLILRNGKSHKSCKSKYSMQFDDNDGDFYTNKWNICIAIKQLVYDVEILFQNKTKNN